MTRKLSEYHKRRIAAALGTPKSVSATRVLTEIEVAIEKLWRDSEPEARIQGVKKVVGRTLYWVLKHHEPKWNPKTERTTSAGAPPESALRACVISLVMIYERSTGEKITRNVDRDWYKEKPTPREKPHLFLSECMKAAGKAYPPGIVKQVLRELHAPTKKPTSK